jgi:hypothetical protein
MVLLLLNERLENSEAAAPVPNNFLSVRSSTRVRDWRPTPERIDVVCEFQCSRCPQSINIEIRNNLFFSFRPATPAMPCSVEGVF